MATFEAQVEGLTGLSIDGSSSPTQTELSQFLKDGVVDITNKSILTKPQDADNFSRESAEQTSNGFNPGTGKIVSVIREAGTDGKWYPCNRKPINLQYLVTDTESLHFASKYNPVFMMTQNRNVHVYPAPSTDGNDGFKVLYINYDPEESDGTDLQYDSTGIKWFPDDKLYLVSIYASIKSLENALSAKSFPSDISIPALETVSTSLPTFSEPSGIVMPASLTDADISFTLPEFPVFIQPSVPTLSDSSITLPTNTPFFSAPLSKMEYANIDTYIDTEEDIELAGSKIQEMNLKLQEYQADIQSNLNTFNSNNVQYQAGIQKALQDGQLNSQDDAQKIQKYSAEIQAESTRIQNASQEYQQKLSKSLQTYQLETGYDIAKLNADIQKEVQKFTQDLAKENAKYQADLAKYQGEVAKVSSGNQTTIQIFSAKVQKYSTEVQKSQADYQWMQGRQQSLLQQYYSAFAQGQPAQQAERRR